MIRLGCLLSLIGLSILVMKPSVEIVRWSLILTGLGYAPLYPSMMHETPKRFNLANGALLIGLQVGIAYVGGTIMSNAMGQWFAWTSINWLFPLVFGFTLLMLVVSELYAFNTSQHFKKRSIPVL